jgi:hypothetical protein
LALNKAFFFQHELANPKNARSIPVMYSFFYIGMRINSNASGARPAVVV